MRLAKQTIWLALVLVVQGWLIAPFHFHLVEHGYSVEHGHSYHVAHHEDGIVGGAPVSTSVGETALEAIPFDPPGFQSSGEACRLLDLLRHQFSNPPVLTSIGEVLPSPIVLQGGADRAFSLRSLYRLAPKQSPPHTPMV